MLLRDYAEILVLFCCYYDGIIIIPLHRRRCYYLSVTMGSVTMDSVTIDYVTRIDITREEMW